MRAIVKVGRTPEMDKHRHRKQAEQAAKEDDLVDRKGSGKILDDGVHDRKHGKACQHDQDAFADTLLICTSFESCSGGHG